MREDIYKGHEQKYLKATVLVGLDPSLTVKAHIMMPEDQAFNLLSYILNFHFFDDEAEKMYAKSKFYDEPDIYFYFGELKKGTLTFAFYGLSGSGKSTLTHEMYDGKYDITVLHDDAFIISREDGSSVALEPSYFDKTHDYPAGHHETKYYTTIMNCDVTLDSNGKKVIVTEDLRNNNGRVIKTRYTSPHRVDFEKSPITALF